MKTIQVEQGSPEWHAFRADHFTASDAPAAMGESKYKKRGELIKEKATGIVPEVSDAQQELYDRGHAAEAAARPIAEEIIGEELFPATGESDDHPHLAASFDGITMCETIIWEHKLINSKLAEATVETLEEQYKIQMDQQLLVSGAERCLFMASDGTADNCNHFWYERDEDRLQKIVAIWGQVAVDIENYEHKEAPQQAIAAPVSELPAIVYKLDGLALTSNIEKYRKAALALVEESKLPIETDQDFADREALNKAFKAAEEKLGVIREQVLGEIEDVDTFCRGLDDIRELVRQARLNGEKQVKSRKESIKIEIVDGAKNALSQHIDTINGTLGEVTLTRVAADFAGVIKGKRTVASIQEAVDTELARAKIEASAIADQIRVNLGVMKAEVQDEGYTFLFPDFSKLVVEKQTEDLRTTIKLRIMEHKEAEQKRLDAERERIRKEEQERADREAKAKALAEIEACSFSDEKPVEVPAPVHQEDHGEETIKPVKPAAAPIAAGPKPMTSAEAKAEKVRPSTMEIVHLIARHYDVEEIVACEWLEGLDMDLAWEKVNEAAPF